MPKTDSRVHESWTPTLWSGKHLERQRTAGHKACASRYLALTDSRSRIARQQRARRDLGRHRRPGDRRALHRQDCAIDRRSRSGYANGTGRNRCSQRQAPSRSGHVRQRSARGRGTLRRANDSAAGGTPIRSDQITTSWYGAVGVNMSIPVFNGFLFSSRAHEADLRTSALEH